MMMGLAKDKAEGSKDDQEIVNIVDCINRGSYESVNSPLKVRDLDGDGKAGCGGQGGVSVEAEMEIMKEVDSLAGGAEMLVGDESRNAGVDGLVDGKGMMV